MMYHGYELTSEWGASQCGHTARARKGGKDYFLKEYNNCVGPIDNGTLSKEHFIKKQMEFDEFVAVRTAINKEIGKITGEGGNIIIPRDWFIEGNKFVEASEFVPGVVPDGEIEDVIGTMTLAEKKLLMQTAAAALASVHKKHIVHSDLKLPNVLLVKNAPGKGASYVAKLIDFDSSYFEDNKPEEIIGTFDFYSPELGAYADAEDEREELAEDITVKSDIFSLGLIYHIYLTGKLPEATDLTDFLQKQKDKGDPVYCWVALNSGCSVELDPTIPEEYRDLIADMLKKDPDERPTALEVLARLKEMPDYGTDGAKAGSTAGRRVGSTAGSTAGRTADSTSGRKVGAESVTKDAPAPGTWDEPWDGEIVFDTDRLKRSGFVSGVRAMLGGVKGYRMYKAKSGSVFITADKLLLLDCAVKSDGSAKAGSVGTESVKAGSAKDVSGKAEPDRVEPGIASPWSEHNIEFDAEMIRKKGFARCEQQVLNGVKGYAFIRSDGKSRFLRVETVLMQDMAKAI